MDVKIPWNRTGKLTVSLLSERSNIFSRMLGPYAHTGAILDKEDAAVELKRMFADIVEACKELQESGQDVKRLMSVDYTSSGKGAAKTTTTNEATGDESNPCYLRRTAPAKAAPTDIPKKRTQSALRLNKAKEAKATKIRRQRKMSRPPKLPRGARVTSPNALQKGAKL